MNLLVLLKSPAWLLWLMLALSAPTTGMAANYPLNAAQTKKFDAWRYGDQQVNWKSGPFVELCTRNNAACLMAKMPKTLGKIEDVLSGPFIQRARASWVVQSRLGMFVCAALTGRSAVACTKIEGDALPLRYVALDVEITASNRSRINVKGKSAMVNQVRVSHIETAFRNNFLRAVDRLQGEADYAGALRATMSSTMNVCDHGLGDPPHHSCAAVEVNGVWMWACDIVGENPPDPGPVPDPDPYPEPEPLPDPEPEC